MLVLAIAMIPLLLAPALFELSDSITDTFFVADWFIWAAFALELVIKTYLSPSRAQYLKAHWFDVVIVVVPFLRPLRIVRSVRILRVARGARALSYIARLSHSMRLLVDSNGIKYALMAGSLLFFASAMLALLFERENGGNITNFGDAIWWATVTITTVGYGDHFPVTTEGRAIAVFLMFLGISLFSLITASVAAMFVRPEQKKEEATLEDVLHRLEEMEARLVALQRNGASPNAIVEPIKPSPSETRAELSPADTE
jgi:voltage-gated potassium channel